jgi:hypothetical protein
MDGCWLDAGSEHQPCRAEEEREAPSEGEQEGRRWKEREGQWLQTAQEETPIGGLQTPKVAIIAESGGTSPPLFTRFIYQCQ